MATATLLNPVSEEAENRKREAQKHFSVICKSGGLVSVNSLRIGYHAYALKKDNLFQILGFECEDDAREASGVGQSTWYANLALAEKFTGVAEELFCGMKQANAKALADLPESQRLTEYWVRRAATDSIDTFKAVIETELNGKAKESDGKERTVSATFKMPASRKKAVEEGLKDYAKEVGVPGDTSRALELMVEERRQSVSLLGSITHAIERVGTIKKLSESGLSAEEVLWKAMSELDAMVGEFELAVLAVQQGEVGE